MANEWKWKEGPRITVAATAATAYSKGTPCYFVSNEATVVADGGTVDLVAATDVTSGAVGQYIMPMGDIFEVHTAADMNVGDRAYMAASYCVDAGSAGNVTYMSIVDYNPASSGSALISVMSALHGPKTHT